MKKLSRNELLEALSYYGYELFRPGYAGAPEDALENLLKSDDSRLIEGFPVVLFNAMGAKKRLAWESPNWRPAAVLSARAEKRFSALLAVTYHLLTLYGLGKEYRERVMKLLKKCKSGTTWVSACEGPLARSRQVAVDGLELDGERLKTNFRNYVLQNTRDEDARKMKRELTFELLLSELFTPRQKELLKKRAQNKPMTKTEKEYFYRVVSKRLKALASDEIHQMAKALVNK